MVKVRVIINLLVKGGLLYVEPLPSQMTNETYSDCHRQADEALSHFFSSLDIIGLNGP